MFLSVSPIRPISGLSSLISVVGVLLAATASLPLGAQAPATTAPSDQTYMVQRTFKAGDVDRYRLKVNTKMNGAQTNGAEFEIHLNMLMKETTKSVAANGLITVVDEYLKADAELNGMPMDMLAMMPKVTLTKDKKGTVEVSTEGGNDQVNAQISGMAKQLMQSASATLPTKPVKVGDSWTSDISNLTSEGGGKATITVTLASIETLNGVKALRLNTITDTTGGADPSNKMHGEGSVYINAQNGKAIKMNSKASGTAAGNKINVEMSFDQAGPEDEKAPPKEGAPK